MKKEVLRFHKVTYYDGNVPVLENINLNVFGGEVMGIVCINSYAQAELVELIKQNRPLHYGKIFIENRLVNSYAHSSMAFNRVSIIDQERQLVDDLTVADNIFVLRRGFRQYWIKRNVLEQQLRQFTEDLSIDINGNAYISQLSPYKKCVVELLKAVVLGHKLIVIRNISNYISSRDLRLFQKLVRHYCKKGFSFLYICNHHEEAFKICDRLALMRNTRIQKILRSSDFSREKVEPYYLDLLHKPAYVPPRSKQYGVVRFEQLYTDRLQNFSMTVEAGESVLLLDMDHTALQDIMQVMNGELVPFKGQVFLENVPYLLNRKRPASQNAVACIQKYPVSSMLFREISYLDNLCILLDKKQSKVRIGKKVRKSIIREYGPMIGSDIYAPNLKHVSLSSLYNLIYYRVHLSGPKVVFCVQPFSGADVELRMQIIHRMRELKKKGIAVVMLSVNFSDSLMVADRLVIVKQGRVFQQFDRSDFHYFSKEATVL